MSAVPLACWRRARFRQPPASSARGRHIRNPASRRYRACVRHVQGPRGSTLCRAQSAFDQKKQKKEEKGGKKKTKIFLFELAYLMLLGDPSQNPFSTVSTTNWICISSLAATARLPTMSGFWEYVEAGGLMSYGANFPVPFRQRRRLCRQDSAQDHGRISRTGNRAVGHRVRLQCPYPGIKSVR